MYLEKWENWALRGQIPKNICITIIKTALEKILRPKKISKFFQGWQPLLWSLSNIFYKKLGKNLKTWYYCVLLPKYLEYLKKFKKISKNRCQGCHISWFLHRICPICTSYWSTLKSWKSAIVGIHWNQNHASRELCRDMILGSGWLKINLKFYYVYHKYVPDIAYGRYSLPYDSQCLPCDIFCPQYNWTS